MPNGDLISINDLPCCPEITRKPCCESLRVSYRLTNRQLDVPVEIVIVAEPERCPGPMSLGDVVYSTTLLPDGKVRLYTSTRNIRFTYDADSEVSYRHEQSSEETCHMRSMDRYMSDLTVTDSGSDAVGVKLAAGLTFERTYCLPTQGIVVKGCLDRCNTCEESRQKAIERDLMRQDLENQLLARKIALLERAREYRCRPVAATEPEDA